MGSFNILVAEIKCPGCGKTNEGCIQFKYAHKWQYRFKIGDTLQWSGSRYDSGNPGIRKVKAYGIIESTECPFCNENTFPEEYDIFIEENVLISFSVIESLEDYLQYPTGEGTYIVLEA